MTAKVIQGSFLGGQLQRPSSHQPKIVPPPFQVRTALVSAKQAQPIQRYGAGGAFAIEAGPLGLMSSGGRALPEAVRGKMEAALGADFSSVRVHVGQQAERIGAIAFTIGSDIYFAPGRYQPETIQGQQLLGHELAHVVQQRQGRVRNPLGAGIAVVQDRALEAEADRLGHRAATQPAAAQAKLAPGSFRPANPPPTHRAGLQRKAAPWPRPIATPSPIARHTAVVSPIRPLVQRAAQRGLSARPEVLMLTRGTSSLVQRITQMQRLLRSPPPPPTNRHVLQRRIGPIPALGAAALTLANNNLYAGVAQQDQWSIDELVQGVTAFVNECTAVTALVTQYDQNCNLDGTPQPAALPLLNQILADLSTLSSVTQQNVRGLLDTSHDSWKGPLYTAEQQLLLTVDQRFTDVSQVVRKLIRSVNKEAERVFHIERVGPGRRPDLNSVASLESIVKALSPPQREAVEKFFKAHAGNDEAKSKSAYREALSAIWAREAGLFRSVEGLDKESIVDKIPSLKHTPKSLRPDVDYYAVPKTGIPYQFWDQKTFYTSKDDKFDVGGLVETHRRVTARHLNPRAEEDPGQVGLLLDATFEGKDNYQRHWLKIFGRIAAGELPAEAVREVSAPPDRLTNARSYYHVEAKVERSGKISGLMRETVDLGQAKANDVCKNIMVMEKLIGYSANQTSLPVINNAFLVNATSYVGIANQTAKSWTRFRNHDRKLPTNQQYSEFSLKHPELNATYSRFVVPDGFAGAVGDTIYISVTHYDDYTIDYKRDRGANIFLRRSGFFICII